VPRLSTQRTNELPPPTPAWLFSPALLKRRDETVADDFVRKGGRQRTRLLEGLQGSSISLTERSATALTHNVVNSR
jgi:hypothetical protein